MKLLPGRRSVGRKIKETKKKASADETNKRDEDHISTQWKCAIVLKGPEKNVVKKVKTLEIVQNV